MCFLEWELPLALIRAVLNVCSVNMETVGLLIISLCCMSPALVCYLVSMPLFSLIPQQVRFHGTQLWDLPHQNCLKGFVSAVEPVLDPHPLVHAHAQGAPPMIGTNEVLGGAAGGPGELLACVNVSCLLATATVKACLLGRL